MYQEQLKRIQNLIETTGESEAYQAILKTVESATNAILYGATIDDKISHIENVFNTIGTAKEDSKVIVCNMHEAVRLESILDRRAKKERN